MSTPWPTVSKKTPDYFRHLALSPLVLRMLYMLEEHIEGPGVCLRDAVPSDAQIISAWKSDPLIRKMALDEDAVVSVEGERESIARACESDKELYLLIVLKDANLPIGYIRINWVDSRKRSAWLRFALGAERGMGYAHEGLSLILAYLFSFGCHRVEAEVYDFNTRSLALLERLGFKKEGVKQEAHHDSDGYHDVVVVGLIKDSYLPLSS